MLYFKRKQNVTSVYNNKYNVNRHIFINEHIKIKNCI